MTAEHRDAYFRRGCALRVNGRADLAAREFEKAVEADPQHARSFAMLAYCRNDLGDPRAIEASRTAVALDPTDAFNHRARGWTFIGAQRASEAVEPARAALSLSPHETENFVLLAEALLRTADYAGALRAADDALALRPAHPTAHLQRSIALRHLGRLEEATIAAQKALALDPNGFWSHLVMARTAAARRDAVGAARSYREALRLDPSSAEARQGLVRAMKSRNAGYRWIAAFHTWFFRLPRLLRIGIALALVFGAAGVGAFVLIPIILLGHVADPLANLVLRFDRYGRQLLTPSQIVSSDVIAALLLGAAGVAVPLLFGASPELVVTTAFAGMSVPTALRVRNCRPGRATLWMGVFAASAIVAGLCCPWAVAHGVRLTKGASTPDLAVVLTLGGVAAGFYAVIGLLLGSFVARRCGYPWSHRFDTASR